MRHGILKTTALALGLGMATGLAYAQTDATQPRLQDQSGAAATAKQKVQGQAGATMKQGGDAAAQAGGATTESGSTTTAQGGAAVKKDGADAAASGQAGADTGTTTLGGATKQDGTDSAASGAEAGTETTAEGAAKQDGTDSAASGQAGAETESTAQGEAGADTEDSASDASKPSSETTASIDITTEQQTELRTVFTETRVEPVRDIDIDISVGVAIPRTIELHPLPPRVVEIVPVYSGYQYFVLTDGRIVIVEPATFEIVYILTV